MKSAELIAELQKMPPDAEVGCVWDGAMRTTVQLVWLTKEKAVALADYGEVVYYDDDRPTDAPTQKEDPYWSTPDEPTAQKE